MQHKYSSGRRKAPKNWKQTQSVAQTFMGSLPATEEMLIMLP